MSEFDQEDEFDDEFFGKKSKSRVKRELNQLKDLGRRLVELPARDLAKLDLPENIQQAVLSARSMSKGALKRQIGYIGGLIAGVDHQLIQHELDNLSEPHLKEVQQFHQLELWRERLLAGDDVLLSKLNADFAQFDLQYVRQLVRNAHKELARSKSPKSARQLFKHLQSMDVVD